MRRFGIIILTLFFMAILLSAWVVCDNWNTIIAVVDSFRYTQEELTTKLEENKAELQKYLDDNEAIVVRDLTEEEQAALNEGKITEDQAVLILTGQSTLEEELAKAPPEEPTESEAAEEATTDAETTNGEQPADKPTSASPDTQSKAPADKKTGNDNKSDTSKPNTGTTNKTTTTSPGKSNTTTSGGKTNTTTSGGNKSNDKTTGSGNKGNTATQSTGNSTASTDQKISEYIAQLYVYKNDFLNRLSGLETMISDEFYSQPQSEWNRPNKERIISKYIGMVGQWESECDTKVYGILGLIEETLIAAGRDTEIVGRIEENYLSEKRIKKAYYMDIYTK